VRALFSFAIAAVAVIVQVTIVDRIAFPGGTGPDLVLLSVAALGLANGALVGALTGFWAGLALDVAPPGSHLVGQNALVFCLIGYLCGLAADEPAGEGVPEQGHTALFEIVVMAAAAVCGEALASLLGAMLSDPRVTWPAIKHVLPVAVLYDVMLCPFVLFGVAAVLRLAPSRGDRDRAAWPSLATQAPAPGAVRQAGTKDSPRLRLSERGKGKGWVGGVRGQGTGWPAAKREPRLNLGRSSLGGSALGAAYAAGGAHRGPGTLGAPVRLRGLKGSTSLPGLGTQGKARTGGLNGGPVKVRFGARPRTGVLGGSLLGGSLLVGSASRTAALRTSRFGRSRMGRSLLGGSVFSRSSSVLNRPAPVSRSAPMGQSALLGRSSFLGRASFWGRTPWLTGSSSLGRSGTLLRPGGTAGHAPRFSKGSSLARLAAALRRSARPSSTLQKSPGRGWLRRTPSRSGVTGSGAMGRRTMGRGAFGRGASSKTIMGRGYTAGSAPRLRTGRPARLGPARLHMPRPKAKRSRRTGGYR
jgi:rod shape-determining protein MreD